MIGHTVAEKSQFSDFQDGGHCCQMAAAAIFDFQKFEILTVGPL